MHCSFLTLTLLVFFQWQKWGEGVGGIRIGQYFGQKVVIGREYSFFMVKSICSSCRAEIDIKHPEKHFIELQDGETGIKRKCNITSEFAEIISKDEEKREKEKKSKKKKDTDVDDLLGIEIPMGKRERILDEKKRALRANIESAPNYAKNKKVLEWFIKRIEKDPSYLENPPKLSHVLSEYFTVNREVVKWIWEDFEKIEKASEGKSGLWGEFSKREAAPRDYDSSDIIKEEMGKVREAIERTLGGGNKIDDKILNEAVEGMGSFFKNWGQTGATVREFFKTVFIEEAKTNPGFRKRVIKDFGGKMIGNLIEEEGQGGDDMKKNDHPSEKAKKIADMLAGEGEDEKDNLDELLGRDVVS